MDFDVEGLGRLHDFRAIPILREALDSKWPTTVMMAVSGLAQLNDSVSLPLIVRACRRFPPKEAQLIASALSGYDDPAVEPLFDALIADAPLRDEVKQRWRERLKKK